MEKQNEKTRQRIKNKIRRLKDIHLGLRDGDMSEEDMKYLLHFLEDSVDNLEYFKIEEQ